MKTVIWGLGSAFKQFITIRLFDKTAYLIDNGYAAKGIHVYMGKPVYSQAKLIEDNEQKIVLIAAEGKNYTQIKSQLDGMGFVENQNYFGVAYITPAISPLLCTILGRSTVNEFSWTPTYIQRSNTVWYQRIQSMLTLLPDDISSVLDIGAGEKKLQGLLPASVAYYSMDREAQFSPDYVLDWNGDYAINIQPVEYGFASGAFEYIQDLEQFICKLSPFVTNGFVCSYRPWDYYKTLIYSRPLIWKNFYSLMELIMIFHKNGFILSNFIDAPDTQSIAYFTKIQNN